MNLELIAEVVALALAIIAAALSMRGAPPLDWERLFKVTLATVIRGDVEASGGGAEQWWERLRGVVPYHPAARDPQAKLKAPSLEAVAVPALEGERALVAALEKQDSPAARWAVMYEGEASQDALMGDPDDLGPAYDPSAVLAPDAGWPAVAGWSDAVQSALARRLSDVVVMVVGGSFAEPMRQAVPHARVSAVVPASADIVGAALNAGLTQPADRAVILVGGDDVQPVLQALHGDPSLRDRVLAVISVGGSLTGPWMAAHFTHEGMDTELNRSTAYMDLIDVDPDEPVSTDWSEQCFVQPQVPDSGWAPIERVGLGPLPLTRQDPVMLARAVWVLLAFRLASR